MVQVQLISVRRLSSSSNKALPTPIITQLLRIVGVEDAYPSTSHSNSPHCQSRRIRSINSNYNNNTNSHRNNNNNNPCFYHSSTRNCKPTNLDSISAYQVDHSRSTISCLRSHSFHLRVERNISRTTIAVQAAQRVHRFQQPSLTRAIISRI